MQRCSVWGRWGRCAHRRRTHIALHEPAVKVHHRLGAVSRVLAQRTPNSFCHMWRGLWVHPTHWRRRGVQLLPARALPLAGPVRSLGLSSERPPAGQHLVGHDPQRVHVGAPVERLAATLLRRHVRHRAGHDRRHGGAVDRLGNPKVGHKHPAVASQHDVARLDIAMDDALLVSIVERRTHLAQNITRLVQRHGPFRL